VLVIEVPGDEPLGLAILGAGGEHFEDLADRSRRGEINGEQLHPGR
jgi:hypothetical protein